jgi:hypothetical protein
MPMFFFQFEVRPKQTHPNRDRYGCAMANCWVMRETQAQAEAVARGWIGDQDWRIIHAEQATLMTKEQQAQNPDGMRYFEQAEIDREVFVFHTCPIDAPDTPQPEHISREELAKRLQHEVKSLTGADLTWWAAHRVPPFAAQHADASHYIVAAAGVVVIFFADDEDEFGIGKLSSDQRITDYGLAGDLIDAVRIIRASPADISQH